ncbi:uncharacterized protein [Amphiura filiformis]|uniref:uncharacterized protein n=1 Tax=Amphiura filiformis TaxID=82378 RepID=UPI003B21BE93
MAKKQMSGAGDLMKTMDDTIEELHSSFENLRKRAREALTPPRNMPPVLRETLKDIPGCEGLEYFLNSSRSLRDMASMPFQRSSEERRNQPEAKTAPLPSSTASNDTHRASSTSSQHADHNRHNEKTGNKTHQVYQRSLNMEGAATRNESSHGSTLEQGKISKAEKRREPRESRPPATISVIPSSNEETSSVLTKAIGTFLTSINQSSPSSSNTTGVAPPVTPNKCSVKRRKSSDYEPQALKKFKSNLREKDRGLNKTHLETFKKDGLVSNVMRKDMKPATSVAATATVNSSQDKAAAATIAQCHQNYSRRMQSRKVNSRPATVQNQGQRLQNEFVVTSPWTNQNKSGTHASRCNSTASPVVGSRLQNRSVEVPPRTNNNKSGTQSSKANSTTSPSVDQRLQNTFGVTSSRTSQNQSGIQSSKADTTDPFDLISQWLDRFARTNQKKKQELDQAKLTQPLLLLLVKGYGKIYLV